MMRPFLLATLTLLTSCVTHIDRSTASSPARVSVPQFTLQRDVIYSPKRWPQELRADVYQPAGDGPWPGVLLIHGGSWTAKDRRSDMDSIAERLVKRGYVVVNATYRLAPKYLHPAQVRDLQQALTWMRDHAQTLKLDATRIASFGYSAGGHLAAMLGGVNAPAKQRVQAVVAGGAPLDLRKWPASAAVILFLGGTLREIPDTYADASPVVHISKDDPPVFLYHGSWDMLVPPDHSEDYHAALKKAGVRSELLWQRGLGHVPAFFIDGTVIERAIEFLDRELNSQRNPPKG
jgi:acetyl esterase/lipase